MKNSWPCGTCSESDVQKSSMSENLTLKMSGLPQQCDKNFLFQDQDSSSTQSTGQSYMEVGSRQLGT
jgi:nuclear transcription factor Y alpha